MCVQTKWKAKSECNVFIHVINTKEFVVLVPFSEQELVMLELVALMGNYSFSLNLSFRYLKVLISRLL